MAEFYLGRIKFVYQGNWTTGTSYVVDDVVTVSGKTYICVVSHTASTLFVTDLNFVPSKWSLVSDGQSWKNTWTASTYYNAGDLVKYYGIVYQCNAAHFSTPSAGPTSVAVTSASGVNGLATLTFSAQPSAPFAVGQTITVTGMAPSGYNGTVVVTSCSTTQVSFASAQTGATTVNGFVNAVGGLESNQTYWDIFANAFNWRNSWATTTYYHVGDLVSYGGYVYYCITSHSSAATTTLGLENNAANWQVFNAGITYLGAWTSGVRYRTNDVVKQGADLWICVSPHTAGTAIDATGTYFQIFLNGLEFLNSWTNSTAYIAGDIVTYGGYSYVATQNNTNQIPSTATSYWVVYTTGFNFVGDWNTSTSYKTGNVVRQNGYTYLATTDSAPITQTVTGANTSSNNAFTVTSTTGIVPGMSVNFSYTPVNVTATATTATGSYILLSSTAGLAIGMPVTFSGSGLVGSGITNGQLYYITAIAGAQIVVSLNFQGSPITLTSTSSGTRTGVAGGFQGGVVGTATYYVQSVPNATTFTVATTQTGTALTLAPASGIMTAVVAVQPPNGAYWARLNNGFQWTNYPQTFSAPTVTAVTGTGTAATFSVIASGTVYTVTLTGGGSGYVSGNVLKIAGTQVGGLSPANDILITVGTTTGAITAGNFTFTGFASTWQAGQSFSLGDVTFWGASSYTCVQSHVSATANRPDSDLTAAFWNLLASGAEVATLTTQGDTFYYGLNGPTRLPIGSNGQLLRVTNGYPTWATYGLINNLVYVGPLGTDAPAPAFGLSVDTPWQTVRYACQQIEAGYQNPQAQMLLQMNKQFMMQEVANYVSYTYNASVTGTSTGAFLTANTAGLTLGQPIRFASAQSFLVTGVAVSTTTTYYVTAITNNTSFTVSATLNGAALNATGTGTTTVSYYTSLTSEIARDAGIVIDAFIFDLGHGGTTKTTAAALAYFTTAGNGFINTAVQAQANVFIGAQNYLATLAGLILANTAPGSNYQTLNGVSAGNRAIQQINANYTPEANTTAQVQSYISIITTGLAAGATTAIPAVINPNTTISIKTGTYNEVLPINVPSFTALVGDELRSTVVQPMAADPQLATVIPKNAAALTQIQSLIPNLMSNTTITPTSGNTTSQVTSLPAASTGSTTAITNLKTAYNTLYNIVASGTKNTPVIVQPSPTNWAAGSLTNVAYACSGNATGSTAGYANGVAQIKQNYAFLVSETLGWLQATYPSIWSAEGPTNTISGYRDITHILDSIVYDMTYGGNSMSERAGSSYYSFYALNILASEKAPFVQAIQRLQTVISSVVTAASVSPTNTSVTQVTSGSAGSANAATYAQALLTMVIDWINNGSADAVVMPYTGWATSDLQAAFAAVNAQIANNNIQLDTVGWVTKFYQNVPLSQSLTQRDAGLTATYLAYDMVFGSNFNAIQCGRAYCRANASDIALRNTAELAPTLGAINFQYYKVKQIAASGATVQIQTTIDDINAFLVGGVAPPVITNPQPALPSNITYSAVAGTNVTGTGSSATFNITRYNNGNGVITTVNGAVINAAGSGYSVGNTIKILGTQIGGVSPSNDLVLTVSQASAGGIVAVTETSVPGALRLLESNREFILAEIIAYINANYSSITTDPSYTVAKTKRDMGYILDAIHYDLLYGGNWQSQEAGMAYYSALYGTQITSGFSTAFVSTIGYASTITQSIITNTAISPPALQGTVSQVLAGATQTIGNSGVATNAGALFTIVSNIVTNGLTTGVVRNTVTTITGTNTFTTSTAHGLSIGDIVIPQTTSNGLVSTVVGSGTQYFVASIPANNQFTLSASYNGTTLTSFTNGTGLSIVVQTINMPYIAWTGTTNLAAFQAVSSALAANYQSQVVTFINTNYSALTYNSVYAQRDTVKVTRAAMYDMLLGSNFASITAGRAYNRTQDYAVQGYEKTATVAALNYLITLVASTLSPYTAQATSATNNISLVINYLSSASSTVKPEVNGTVTYNNNVNLIKGAEILRANIPFLASEVVAYYAANYGGTVSGLAASGNLITTSGNHNLNVNDPVTFSGTAAGGIAINTVYYVASTPSNTTFTITTAEGYLNTNTGTTYSAVALSTVGSPTLTVAYYHVPAQTRSDVTYFLNAIIYDLQYTGNYRSLRAAQVLYNAVNGSQLSNMWLVRNGCGVRNMTLTGLNGTLTVANAYGTKRPTAGAYTSLDPGFGPYDSNAWVSSRSTYVQNCTLFGNGCTGLKIDGALHAGGNRSIVANDYTTIMSDGIGAWCTGSNALTELVSVFCYYSYSGYLAELGGKIRATNGNSSYGVYGVIAEGVDSYETPLYANLNNQANGAYITNVLTDNVTQVLRMEYENAGQNYTNVQYTIGGTGYNTVAVGNEFRDGAVFESRLIDLNDGNGVGGANYLAQANIGQGGNTYSITIAGTDLQLATAYIGERILITAGSGVGQSAFIVAYNNGSKTMLVAKEGFTSLTVSSANATGNTFTLASGNTNSLYANMPIWFTGTAFGGANISIANPATTPGSIPFYVIGASLSTNGTTFQVAASSGSVTPVSLNNDSGTMTVVAAGWDHVIPGKAIASALDLTSQYIIEPRLTYSAPGYLATARTLPSSQEWTAVTYGAGYYVAVSGTPLGANTAAYSADGKNWSLSGQLPTSQNWQSVTYGGGQGAVATAVVGGLGGVGCVLSCTLGTGLASQQVASVTVVSGGTGYLTAPTIVFTSVTGTGAVATCTVLNGVVQTVTVTVPGNNYATVPTVTAATDRLTGIVVTRSGSDYCIAPNVVVSGGGSSNQATVLASLSNNGISTITLLSTGSGYTSTPTVTITDTNAKFIATANGVINTAYQSAASLGSTWNAGGSMPGTSFVAVTYGTISSTPTWVAVGGTNSAASSSDGLSWISKVIPALGLGTYVSVAYGAGYFVAISNNTATAYSLNGNTWTVGGNLPSAQNWNSVTFGNGRFVAVSGTGTATAYSIDFGVTWTSFGAGLPSVQNWKSVTYGQGTFLAVSDDVTAPLSVSSVSRVGAATISSVSRVGTAAVSTVARVGSATTSTYQRYGTFNFYASSRTGTTVTVNTGTAVQTSLATAVVTTSIVGLSGQFTIAVSSTTGIYKGMLVTGTGIGTNAKVDAAWDGTSTVLLTVANSSNPSGTGTFGNNAVTVGSTVGIVNGTNVAGTNVSGTVSAVYTSPGNVIILSATNGGTPSGTGTFYTTVVHGLTVGGVTTTATGLINTNYVTVGSVAGLMVGMSVASGTGFVVGSTITAINGTTLTLSSALSAGVTGGSVTFTYNVTVANSTSGLDTTNVAITVTTTSAFTYTLGSGSVSTTYTTTGLITPSSITAFVTTASGGLWNTISTTGTTGTIVNNLIPADVTVANTSGVYTGMAVKDLYGSATLTPSATAASGNLITVPSTATLVPGQPVQFTSTPATSTVAGTANSSQSISITGGVLTGTIGTLTYAAQSTIPFVPNETITITGANPPGLNTTWVVQSATKTSVTFATALSSTAVTPTLTGVAAGTPGVFTVSSTSNLVVGEAITFTNVIQTPTLTATTHATITTTGSSISGSVLTIGTITGGTIVPGAVITGGTIPAGTYITANLTGGSTNGSTWSISNWVGTVIPTQASTAINGTVDLITLANTTGIVSGESFIPTTTNGGLTGLSTYYVTSVITSTNQIAVSSTYLGTNVTLTTTTGRTDATTFGSVFGGITSGTTYYIATLPVSPANSMTLSVSSSLSPTFNVTTGANGAWTSSAGAVLAAGTITSPANVVPLASTSGLVTGQSIYFNAPTTTSGAVKSTNATGNLIQVNNTTGLVIGKSITFTGNVSGTGLSAGQQYFVLTIPTSGANGTITVANSVGGSAVTLSTVAALDALPTNAPTFTSSYAIQGSASNTYSSGTPTVAGSVGSNIAINTQGAGYGVGQPVTFGSAFGNVTTGTQYFIQAISTASISGYIAPGTGVTFTGSISGTTLTVASIPTGTGITTGMVLSGGTIGTSIYIVSNLTGTGTSASRTWTINTSVTQSSTTITATPVLLTVTNTASGTVTPGMYLSGTGLTANTIVVANSSGSGGNGTYFVNINQTRDTSGSPGSYNTTSVSITTSQGGGGAFTAGQGGTGTATIAGAIQLASIYGLVAGSTIVFGGSMGASGVSTGTTQYFIVDVIGSGIPGVITISSTYNGSYASITGASLSTATFTAGNPIQISVGSSGSLPTNTVAVTSTSANNITTTSTVNGLGIAAGQPVTFASSLGNIVAGTVYYVLTASGTTMTISQTSGGSVFTVGTGGSNTATIQGTVQLVSSTGLTVGQPVTFSSASIPGTVTATNATGNLITVGNTAALVIGQAISFSGTLTGTGISSGVTYYILTIPTSGAGGTITVSLAYGGSVLPVLTNAVVTASYSAGGPGYVTPNATATSSSGNTVTLSSVTGVSVGQPIQFTGSGLVGSLIVTGQTYYILSLASTNITIGLTQGGSAVTLGNASSGTLTATIGGNLFGNLNASSFYYITTISGNTLAISQTQGGTPYVHVLAQGLATGVAGGTAFGNMLANTPYYITAIAGNNLTISTSFGGSTFVPGNASGAATTSTGGLTNTGITSGTIYFVLAVASTTTFTLCATQYGTQAISLITTNLGTTSVLSGGYVPANTTVFSVNYQTNTVTLSANPIVPMSSVSMFFLPIVTIGSTLAVDGTFTINPVSATVFALTTTGSNVAAGTSINTGTATFVTPTSTVVTSVPHGYLTGYTVNVAGTATSGVTGFDQTNVSINVINSTSFTFTNTGYASLATTSATTGTVSPNTPSAFATITTSAPHYFATGLSVNVTGVSTTGFNASGVTVTVTGASTFTYSNSGISVATTSVTGASVSSTSNIATLTTTSVHGLTTGNTVTIVGTGVTGFDIANVTITVTSTVAFTYVDAGSSIGATSATGFVYLPSNAAATSPDGLNWVSRTLPSASSWRAVAFGNPNNNPLFVVVSDTPGTYAASIFTGATAQGRAKVISGAISEVRMIEPGSGYPKGAISATYAPVTMTVNSSSTTNIIVAATITGVVANQPVTFASTVGTLAANTTYYVVTASGTTLTVSNVVGGSALSVGTTSSLSVSATTQSIVVVDNTENLIANQPVEFQRTITGSGLLANTQYYPITGSISSTSFAVTLTSGSLAPVGLSAATLSATYTAGPIFSITDVNKTRAASIRVRTGNGVLGNPTFTNRGNNNTTSSATVTGDGYSDIYQPANFINVSNMFSIPTPGANVTFASVPGVYYKLVTISNILGVAGNYTATWQINPALTTYLAPSHNDLITTRLKYSQTRLTGHDFLYIGTGNFTQTNYPNVNIANAIQANQQLFSGGGRVFFTSTDQDGNFNVGNLFAVQQATGTATINASAFNLSGLQSLQLGNLTVGTGSAVITSFSSDPYFTANSDNILPTQKAIKTFITSQIGGGQSSLNVNTLTAGVVFIAGNVITTTTGGQIQVKAKMNFVGGIDGAAVAMPFFMQR